jgi:hypothetical protein
LIKIPLTYESDFTNATQNANFFSQPLIINIPSAHGEVIVLTYTWKLPVFIPDLLLPSYFPELHAKLRRLSRTKVQILRDAVICRTLFDAYKIYSLEPGLFIIIDESAIMMFIKFRCVFATPLTRQIDHKIGFHTDRMIDNDLKKVFYSLQKLKNDMGKIYSSSQ